MGRWHAAGKSQLHSDVQKIEKVAKVELDEATGALQAQLASMQDGQKASTERLESFEERAVVWDGLCGRVEADAASAAAARENLKDVFAQVLLRSEYSNINSLVVSHYALY